MLRRISAAILVFGLVLSGLATGIPHTAMSSAIHHHALVDIASADHDGLQGCTSTAGGASRAAPEQMPSDLCCISLVCSPALVILTGVVVSLPPLSVPAPLAEAQVALSAPTDAPFRPPRRSA